MKFKIAENLLPILGFLGFPPFAVEGFVMMNAVSLLNDGHLRQYSGFRFVFPKTVPALLAALGFLIFSLYVFQMINLHSVDSWRP